MEGHRPLSRDVRLAPVSDCFLVLLESKIESWIEDTIAPEHDIEDSILVDSFRSLPKTRHGRQKLPQTTPKTAFSDPRASLLGGVATKA